MFRPLLCGLSLTALLSLSPAAIAVEAPQTDTAASGVSTVQHQPGRPVHNRNAHLAACRQQALAQGLQGDAFRQALRVCQQQP